MALLPARKVKVPSLFPSRIGASEKKMDEIKLKRFLGGGLYMYLHGIVTNMLMVTGLHEVDSGDKSLTTTRPMGDEPG